MTFNIVIANPPYDRKDTQMKFALMAHELATDYSSIIMPAKWQCKGDKTKEKLYSTFRKEVVPHMSKICFYQESTEVFDISEASGITYYIADADKNKNKVYDIKTIENRCEANKYYNDIVTRPFRGGQDSLNNKGQQIIDKVMALDEYTPYLVSEHINVSMSYQIWCNALISNNCITTESGKFINSLLSQTTGKLQVLGSFELNSNKDIQNNLQHDNYNPLFTSDSMLEVASFLSYAYTKFVRFLIFNSICGLRSTGQDTWWRFVPDQTFDHIFTDAELYEKYNLSEEDIAVIEGTIAERPLKTVLSWLPQQYITQSLSELNNKI